MQRETVAQHGFIVEQMIVAHPIESARAQRRDDGIGVGAAYLVAGDGFARLHELVTGRYHHESRLTADAHAGQARGGGDRDLGTAENGSGLEHQVAVPAILATPLNVAERSVVHGAGQGYDTLLEHIVLQRNDAIGTPWERCPGHHFDGTFGIRERQGGSTGGLGGLHRIAAHTAPGRLARDGDAVHADPVEGRVIPLRIDVLAKRTAHALRQGPRLDRQAGQLGIDGGLRRLGGHEHLAMIDVHGGFEWSSSASVLMLKNSAS